MKGDALRSGHHAGSLIMILNERQHLVVSNVRCEALDVQWLELRACDKSALPAFTPGSHLEMYLPNGITRHYSLCNDARERDRYCVAIGLAAESRGGSKLIHSEFKVGTQITCSTPRNNFPLELDSEQFIFIAGGIGITPVMSMIHACEAAQKPWKLFYAARNRQRTAFYETLKAQFPNNCHFHFDDEAGETFNAAKALAAESPDISIYCCGPSGLMESVKSVADKHFPGRAHFEWFSAAPVATPASGNKEFTVVLHRTGMRFQVPPHLSILDVLESNDQGIPFSCREGLCATCKVDVLSGIPDHRDHVLTAQERAGNKHMVVCVSRSQSDVLELDL